MRIGGGKRSIYKMVVTALAIPLLLAFALSTILIYDYMRRFQQSKELTSLMGLATSLGDLIHEQQKERGATSVYLNSGGTLFKTELAEQRRLTDNATVNFNLARRDVHFVAGEDDLSERLDAIVNEITRRPGIRKSVDKLEIALPAALGYYTAHNGMMLDEIGAISGVSSNVKIGAMVKSAVAFMSAKERAGIERAIASGAYAKGNFAFPTLLTLQRLISQQDMGFDFFKSTATRTYLQAFKEMEELPAAEEVRRLRKIAFDFPETRDLQGVEAKDFFGASTKRINAMKAIEDRMADDIVATAQANFRLALMSLLILISVSGLATAASIWMVRSMLKNIVATMQETEHAATEMSEGNFDVPLPDHAPSELAAIIISLAKFRDSILEGRKVVEEQTKAKEEADRTAEERRQEHRRAEDRRLHEDAERARETAERDREQAKEIAKVVQACAQGDFSQRLSTDDKEGAIAEICAGVNRIGEVVDMRLADIREALERLAMGDLSHRMDQNQEGVFSEISATMNRTTTHLAETLSNVRVSASTVDNSARELSAATDDLARRSERNAATLEETAGALQEMSQSVGSASDAAVSAKRSVGEMQERAAQGNSVVQSAVAQMEEISSATSNIERVLGVIDEIAFQTNLLALNAGVEAARAGDAGRGFAVVASEVRSLAERSSGSAREIGDMIAASSESVKRGVKMVNESGEALQLIVSDIQSVVSAIDQIAATFEETKLGIGEISNSTSELDRTTQQNAAMFEETNAAIRTLEGEAQALAQRIAGFRFEELDSDNASPEESDTRAA